MQSETPDKTFNSLPGTPPMIVLTLAGLCAIAYLPALSNGFISDDFVILERVSAWKSDFSYIFQLSPERFRITSYLAFGLLKGIFGYYPAGFYIFAILLHFLNAVLLWKFLGLTTGSPRVAVLGAVLFAAGQSPQEAIMWLAGMNEALQALFILAALLLWMREKFLWSAAACVAALFSKESAAVILLLLPLAEFNASRKVSRQWQILYIALPVILFSLLFIFSLSSNPLASHGYYRFGWYAVLVWLISLHRLMFPWLYIAALLWLAAQRGRWPSAAAPGMIWMTVALLPYIFLTYQNHVPSRHTYLASIGFAWALAVLVEEIRNSKLRNAFIALFVVINIGYLWAVKERQYRQRAAPTSRLIEQLRSHPPEPTLIDDFPLNPWIAKTTTRLVPGWDPQMIRVNEPPESCSGCMRLRWDSEAERYLAF